MLDWLLAPLSGAPTHSIPTWAAWHGRCMVLAWGLMLPLGAIAARYFKVLPGQDWPRQLDNKAWWHAHRVLQWGGVLVMSLGVAVIWGHPGSADRWAGWHGVLGWCLVGAGWAQVLSGLLRGSKGGPGAAEMRGDHYDMTVRRVVFERVHKGLGWAALAASVITIGLGLGVADAPRWMVVVLGAWWSAMLVGAVRWQRQGRCVGTYQAIWGPDRVHPGNRDVSA